MCDPITVAALAAMAGGSYMQSKANREVNNKKKEQVGAEAARQQKLKDQSKQIFEQSLSEQQYPEQDKKLEESTDKRREAITSNIKSEEGNYLPTQSSAPPIIRKIMDEKAKEEVSRATSSGDAMARMGAFDDLNLSNLQKFTRSGQGINNLSTSMMNSANILPMELMAANSEGANSRKWGDALTGIGQVGLMASGAGMGPSWSSLFGSPGLATQGLGSASGLVGSGGNLAGQTGSLKTAFQPFLV